MEDIFSRIYEVNAWHSGSGLGSLPISTVPYRLLVEQIVASENVSTVLEVGCGDWSFSSLIDWRKNLYIGVDIASSVIQRNARLYGHQRVCFVEADVLQTSLPVVDLLIIKDVLQHWTNATIRSFWQRVERFPLVLITNTTNHQWGAARAESDLAENGQFRPLDVTLAPHNIRGFELLRYNACPAGPWSESPNDIKTVLLYGNSLEASDLVDLGVDGWGDWSRMSEKQVQDASRLASSSRLGKIIRTLSSTGSDASGIAIHPIRLDELAKLESSTPQSYYGEFRQRWSEQLDGKVLFLVGWFEDLPVGYLVIHWTGILGEPLDSIDRRCCSVSSIYVHPDIPREMMRTLLIEGARIKAREYGFGAIGISVPRAYVDNCSIESEYSDMGFVVGDSGTYYLKKRYAGGYGVEHDFEDSFVYLVNVFE